MAEVTGESSPSPIARSLGRKSAIGTRRSTRSANRWAGSTVTPQRRRRMNSSIGSRERRSSDAMTTVSTLRSRTTSLKVRAVTAITGFGCVGRDTTVASGFSSPLRKAATLASATGPWI